MMQDEIKIVVLSDDETPNLDRFQLHSFLDYSRLVGSSGNVMVSFRNSEVEIRIDVCTSCFSFHF